MITNRDIKLIQSLKQKKIRHELGLFCVEGVKGVNEFLNSDFKLHKLFSTTPGFSSECEAITENELKKISSLKTPNTALGLFQIPEATETTHNGLILALDDVRDPGNLGTMIRLCDWYGIGNLVCSSSTVDCYNSKVVQATMGSLTRVQVHYLDLENYLKNSTQIIFGTFMEGQNIYSATLPKKGIIVMGNEANGISEAVEGLVNKKLSIPRFGNLKATESLNVATAAAIVLSEFRRSFD